MKRKTIHETANVNNTTLKLHVTTCPHKKKCHNNRFNKKNLKQALVKNSYL